MPTFEEDEELIPFGLTVKDKDGKTLFEGNYLVEEDAGELENSRNLFKFTTTTGETITLFTEGDDDDEDDI